MLAGRVEVGLADLEVDDVAARRLEGAGAGRGLERGLGSEAGHSVGESHARDPSESTRAARGTRRPRRWRGRSLA